MTQQAKPDLPIDDNRPAALRVPAGAGQGCRNGIAHDRIGPQLRLGARPIRNRAGHDGKCRRAEACANAQTLSQKFRR
jgi:hypothetical protein